MMILLVCTAFSTQANVHTSESGGFQVSVPVVMREERKTAQTPEGPREMLIAECMFQDIQYQVIVMPLSEREKRIGAGEFLDRARESLIHAAQGRLGSERAITLDNVLGREVNYSGTITAVKGPGTGSARLFRGEKYFHSVRIFMPTARLNRGEQQRAIAFLNSFSFQGEPQFAAGQAGPSSSAPVAPTVVGPGTTTAQFRPFTSALCPLRILMPSEAVERKQQVAVPGVAETSTMVVITAAAAGATYTVVKMDLPDAIPRRDETRFFDSNVAGILDEVQGKLVSKTVLTGIGFPGRQIGYEGSMPGNGERRSYRARIVLVGRSLYTLTVSAPKGKLRIKDAQKFLESFDPVMPGRQLESVPRKGKSRKAG